MCTTVSSWIDDQHKSIEKWAKNPTDKEEDHLVITAFESLLNNQTSGSATATQFNNILAPRLITGHRFGVGFIWGKLADASRWFGGSHTQQLVDLVVAIKQLPDVINKAGYAVTYDGNIIWRGFPEFGWVFYEHGLDLDLNTEDSTYAEWHAQAPGHLSSHTFAATLLTRPEMSKSMYYADRAFGNIMQPFDETREMADEWKMFIPPAAVWITISGQVIHDLCFKKGTTEESQVKNGDGSSPEKWMQVKQRFVELAEQVDIDDRCRGIAREAAEEMERIEQKA